MCDAVLPVYHTETDAFRLYTSRLAPRLKVRNRTFYRQRINTMYARKKAALKNNLEKAQWVCTTADAWTSRRRAYIGITAHWLDSQLKRRSACLAVRRIVGKCDFEVIAKLLESVYEEFDLLRKLTATVTDNGSNFLKAFRLFGATTPSLGTSTLSSSSTSRLLTDEYDDQDVLTQNEPFSRRPNQVI